MNSQRRAAPGGDVDHPNVKGINPKEWMGGTWRTYERWTYSAQVKSTDQAGMEKEGDIICVNITRGATIKVSISGTDRCT